MPEPPNYLKAAFLLPANLVALAVAAGAAFLSQEPVAAAVAVGMEALYLAALSSAPPFRRAIRARALAATAEPEAQVVAMLEDLGPSQREHYFQLRELRDKILANHRKLPGGRIVAASSEPRVDALLTSFLKLLNTLNGYRKYLNANDRKAVETELTELRADAEREPNARLKEVKQRRAEILAKRVQRFEQAEESRELISHQLASIEDLLRLTHEQSIAIRDSESVSRQLDALTSEVQSTEETVREMERFMEFQEETAPGLPHGTRTT